ncbi:hypothetical protein WOLCODRAFT_156880 [Wolfiporia cocos MD-104 SS10]|uniref:Uncharacterized protein n=1 Tax=Wolfiporia cocos (strain MD-104) TaxID=742152 RepID=A0A2H3JHI0_WOLCO|nr:hypothetical protein WOLCODRAFT_156880 [Wolfiporia cocos MD-104 SS10]
MSGELEKARKCEEWELKRVRKCEEQECENAHKCEELKFERVRKRAEAEAEKLKCQEARQNVKTVKEFKQAQAREARHLKQEAARASRAGKSNVKVPGMVDFTINTVVQDDGNSGQDVDDNNDNDVDEGIARLLARASAANAGADDSETKGNQTAPLTDEHGEQDNGNDNNCEGSLHEGNGDDETDNDGKGGMGDEESNELDIDPDLKAVSDVELEDDVKVVQVVFWKWDGAWPIATIIHAVNGYVRLADFPSVLKTFGLDMDYGSVERMEPLGRLKRKAQHVADVPSTSMAACADTSEQPCKKRKSAITDDIIDLMNDTEEEDLGKGKGKANGASAEHMLTDEIIDLSNNA